LRPFLFYNVFFRDFFLGFLGGDMRWSEQFGGVLFGWSEILGQILGAHSFFVWRHWGSWLVL